MTYPICLLRGHLIENILSQNDNWRHIMLSQKGKEQWYPQAFSQLHLLKQDGNLIVFLRWGSFVFLLIFTLLKSILKTPNLCPIYAPLSAEADALRYHYN